MQLYFQNTDPSQILMRELPSRAPQWSGDQHVLEGVDWPYVNTELFTRFYAKYRAIVISSGQPHGDYGQTVDLYAPGQFTEPDVAALAHEIPVPEHLMSENLPFKPSAMVNRYRYQQERGGDTRQGGPMNRTIYTPRVVEQFFFTYRPVYQPTSFANLCGFLGALRYLSTIVHELNEFKVVLLESGIYVRLTAREIEGAKPPFRMGS